MSKNDRIRVLSETLPKYPKIHNGRMQFDGIGQIIYENHFKKLKELEKQGGDLLIESYAKEVVRYDRWRKGKILGVIAIGLALIIGSVLIILYK